MNLDVTYCLPMLEIEHEWNVSYNLWFNECQFKRDAVDTKDRSTDPGSLLDENQKQHAKENLFWEFQWSACGVVKKVRCITYELLKLAKTANTDYYR